MNGIFHQGAFGAAEAQNSPIYVAEVGQVNDDGIWLRRKDLDEPFVRAAGSFVPISAANEGADALVFFDERVGPMIIAVTRPRGSIGLEKPSIEVDGNREPLEITGEREVTIRCGKASITLTREGKIILRGEYISSRSTGVNRIKGGSVQIN